MGFQSSSLEPNPYWKKNNDSLNNKLDIPYIVEYRIHTYKMYCLSYYFSILMGFRDVLNILNIKGGHHGNCEEETGSKEKGSKEDNSKETGSKEKGSKEKGSKENSGQKTCSKEKNSGKEKDSKEKVAPF
jgi:hypothetical protein